MKKKLQLMYSYKDFIAKDKYKYDTFHSLQDKHKSVHIFFGSCLQHTLGAITLKKKSHYQNVHTFHRRIPFVANASA